MANEFVDTTLMDGYADGPHITEEQTGIANQGLYGPDDYVLEGGKQAEAQILTNNSIRIFDAVYVIQGRRDVIAANDYSDVNIDNGAQGMNRNDIIVRRYSKDESSEIEKTEYAVIKGAPVAGEAIDPEVTEGDIRGGALLHEMKLYRVKLEGLNIVAVEPLFKVLCNMSTLNAYLSELNSNLSYSDTETRAGTWFGVPLYKKTIYIAQLPNDSSVKIPISSIIPKNIRKIEGIGINASVGAYQLQFFHPSGTYGVVLQVINNYLEISTYNDKTSDYAYVTLYYIK